MIMPVNRKKQIMFRIIPLCGIVKNNIGYRFCLSLPNVYSRIVSPWRKRKKIFLFIIYFLFSSAAGCYIFYGRLQWKQHRTCLATIIMSDLWIWIVSRLKVSVRNVMAQEKYSPYRKNIPSRTVVCSVISGLIRSERLKGRTEFALCGR